MNLKEKNHNCKCNHMKFDHDKGLFNRKECTKCNCHEYLRRDFPAKSDKFFAIVMVGMVAVLIGSVPFVYIESVTEYTGVYDMVIHTDEDGDIETVGELLETLLLVYASCVLFYAIVFLNLFLIPVISRRKIRD